MIELIVDYSFEKVQGQGIGVLFSECERGGFFYLEMSVFFHTKGSNFDPKSVEKGVFLRRGNEHDVISV